MWLLALLLSSAVHAQQSASFKLGEHVFNSAGHPDGSTLSSAGYRVTLDAVGEMALQVGLGSTAFRMDCGFSSAYPPPGEVSDLLFTGPADLAWAPEKSVGTYSLYRDLLSTIAGLGYGACLEPGIDDETTNDGSLPPFDDGYFYLVTAENRLEEEGTKGFDSSGAERDDTNVCP